MAANGNEKETALKITPVKLEPRDVGSEDIKINLSFDDSDGANYGEG